MRSRLRECQREPARVPAAGRAPPWASLRSPPIEPGEQAMTTPEPGLESPGGLVGSELRDAWPILDLHEKVEGFRLLAPAEEEEDVVAHVMVTAPEDVSGHLICSEIEYTCVYLVICWRRKKRASSVMSRKVCLNRKTYRKTKISK
jgi:hypothetical protein